MTKSTSPPDWPLPPNPGVFAGALHGSGWVPQRWCDALAESPAGREILAGAIDAGLRLGGGRGGAQ